VNVVCIYVTSLILVQGVTAEVQHNSVAWVSLDEEAKKQIVKLYGSIQRAMLMLLWSFSGGMDWSVAQELVEPLDAFLSGVWIIYISFVMFGLLNVW